MQAVKCCPKKMTGTGALQPVSVFRLAPRTSAMPVLPKPTPRGTVATSAAATAGSVPEYTHSPSQYAKDLLLCGGIVAGVTAVCNATPPVVDPFIHIVAYAIWLGSNVWNSLFVGITMFKTIPRNMFGAVQAKLFPRFFALTTGCNVALIVTLLLSTPGTVNWPALRPLLVASVASVLNWQVFEPLCTGLMFSRWRLEAKPSKSEADAAEISSLYKQFGTWHVVSSMMNLVVFICSVAHGWWMADLYTKVVTALTVSALPR